MKPSYSTALHVQIARVKIGLVSSRMRLIIILGAGCMGDILPFSMSTTLALPVPSCQSAIPPLPVRELPCRNGLHVILGPTRISLIHNFLFRSVSRLNKNYHSASGTRCASTFIDTRTPPLQDAVRTID
jgi:hypothetical protein